MKPYIIFLMSIFLLFSCTSNIKSFKDRTIKNWALTIPQSVKTRYNQDSTEMYLVFDDQQYLRAFVGSSSPKSLDIEGSVTTIDTSGSIITKTVLYIDSNKQTSLFFHSWDTTKCNTLFDDLTRCEGINIESINSNQKIDIIKAIFKSVRSK